MITRTVQGTVSKIERWKNRRIEATIVYAGENLLLVEISADEAEKIFVGQAVEMVLTFKPEHAS